jgi:L-threonate 2-dehydrogenase
MPKPKIACVIGLGSMGMGAATSLLRAGFAVRGVDVSERSRNAFTQAGGTAFSSPAEGARGSDIVFVFVVNDAQTTDVLFGQAGAVAALGKDAVVVCCATVPPAFAAEIGARLVEAGMLAIDAPVSGGAVKAAEGQMTIMGSGADAAFAKAEPFLNAIATKVYKIGATAGMGSQVKLINQLLAGVHIAAACEAMALGIRIGADPQTLYDVISNAAGSSWMFQNRVPHILDGDYAPRSAVDIFVKDLGIVLDTGKKNTFPLPLTAAAHQLYLAAAAKGLGREDDASVVKVYADQTGISLPKSKL